MANLKIRRDKYYMHNDKQYFREIRRLVDAAPFSFDEAETLFGEAFNFCSTIYELLSDSKWQPNIHQTCLVHKRDFSGLNELLDMCQQCRTNHKQDKSKDQGLKNLDPCFLLLTLQPHQHGKAAFEKVSVRVMSIWWRQANQIRTQKVFDFL